MDNIKHPSHYNFGSIEVWDAIDDWDLGWNLGNVVKYTARARHKGTPLKDLKKAQQYLEREIAAQESLDQINKSYDDVEKAEETYEELEEELSLLEPKYSPCKLTCNHLSCALARGNVRRTGEHIWECRDQVCVVCATYG